MRDTATDDARRMVCVYVFGTRVSPAKTAEPFEMLFGGLLMWAQGNVY